MNPIDVSNTSKRDIVKRAKYIHDAVKTIEESIQHNDDEAGLKEMQILKKFIDKDQHVFSTNAGSEAQRREGGLLKEYGDFLLDIRFKSGRMTKSNYVGQLQEVKKAIRADLVLLRSIFYPHNEG